MKQTAMTAFGTLALFTFTYAMGAQLQKREHQFDQLQRRENKTMPMPTLTHIKIAGAGYAPGSPLHASLPDDAMKKGDHQKHMSEVVSGLMLFFLFSTPLIVMMATSPNPELATKTMALVQQITLGMMCIFWYDALDRAMLDCGLHGTMIRGIVHVVFLMVASIMFAWLIQDQPGSYFGIFVGFINVYTTYAAISVSDDVHPAFDDPVSQPMFVLVMFLLASTVYVASVGLRKGLPGTSADFHAKFDRCEMSLIQTCLAYSIMHGIATHWTGHVEHYAKFDKSEGSTVLHTTLESLYIFGISILFLAISVVVPKPKAEEEQESMLECGKRWILSIIGPALFMSCGWGVWIALEWYLYGHVFRAGYGADHPLGSSILFAIIVWVLSFTVTFLFSCLGHSIDDWHVVSALPTVMGIVVGLSVKRPFTLAMDTVAPGLRFKVLLAIASTLTLGPMWAKLVRPKVK